jgi:CRISPR-associated protein Csc3
MPTGTKVQVFSNRLPGGITAEPKRQAEIITALSYQLTSVGANLPTVKKAPPYYLHLTLPKNSSPELLRLWRDFLQQKVNNSDGGPLNVDEVKFYRDHEIHFKPNKVVGLALPKRPEFIYNTVVIPITWGEVNSSIALLKSLGLALELSLSSELGFPFCLSGNIEIEPTTDLFGRVEGVPSSLQSLLGTGQYDRKTAENIRDRLRYLRQITINIASLAKTDDCLYDLARATVRPFTLYYVIFRWVLREQEEPNLSLVWSKICQPLTNLLESFMSEENHLLSQHLRELAQVAVEGKIWGSSFKRTAQSEPFTAFISAIRGQKPYMDLDLIFANLVQQYHTRLDRIREHGVGQTKYEQVKKYYEVLRQLYEQVYHGRADKLLGDRKTLEAAYLFFLEEARQQNRASNANTETETN